MPATANRNPEAIEITKSMEGQSGTISEHSDDPQKSLVASFTRFEQEFRLKYPVAWWLTLVAPVVITFIALLAVGMIWDWEKARNLVSHSILTFFVFGRFIILVGIDNNADVDKYNISLEPSELFFLVTYMDFVAALFVAVHMGILFRIPYVGPKIAMLVWDGKFLMDSQPWIKRIAYLGLVLFVIFPTSTTGSIGGSIFGRLLGLSRMVTVSAVLLGSVLGNGIMLVFAKWINQFVNPNNMWVKIVGIAIIIGLIVLLERRYNKAKNRFIDKKSHETDQSAADG